MKEGLRNNLITKIMIFTVGVSIMTLEILGARIMAPLIGTTIIVWTTVIGVILSSIGFGYYFGGRLADKKIGGKTLSALLFSSSIFIILIIPLKNSLLNLIDFYPYGLSALLASLILFAPPTIFLGATTTYIIRMGVKNISTVGSVNGILYGISTAGNIVGIFLTGFYLIPKYTISTIIVSLGITLFILAGLALTSLESQ